eukprot:CAMPEP_0113475852 /NCGR_PEP_ID=MMETSP0014_2-20120614/19346_1 /TAXON_ID=2857 /ORGANISM="Nitzschia sp." /LENGTH=475 /DNA_ID=CAMNT_0000368809 /DNA_START=559 /DNA_END=1983 /DNA_ORIENTATION=+ /assembly_acc=CAM_ASM_000159
MTRGRGRNRGARPNPAATAGVTRRRGRRAAAAAAAVVETESEDETSVQDRDSSVRSLEEIEEDSKEEESIGGEEVSNEEEDSSEEGKENGAESNEEASDEEGSNEGESYEEDYQREEGSNGEAPDGENTDGTDGDDEESHDEDFQPEAGPNDEDSQGEERSNDEGQDGGAEDAVDVAELETEIEQLKAINARLINTFNLVKRQRDEARAERDEAVSDCKELVAHGEEMDAEIERLKAKIERLQGNDTSMFKYTYTPNANTKREIADAFIEMLEPFKNGIQRKGREPASVEYNIDEVPFELVRDTFSLADNIIVTTNLPKPVLAGLVANLNEFGFYQHKKFLEFWRRIYFSGVFVSLEHCNNVDLSSDSRLTKEAFAVCVMMLLQVPGFADPTINEDGSTNGMRFSNSRNAALWVVDDAEIFDGDMQPEILSEEIVSVMYTNYKQRENLLWAGKYSSEKQKNAEKEYKQYCREMKW